MEQEEAAILAAAEAQAREEEAIRDRLPREVLNIGRRLEEQRQDTKAALDNIHGEIAKLTALVTALATSSAVPQTQGNPNSIPMESRPFSTTPPLPSSSLSPIYELPTPASSNPPYGMPIHFGQLSPNQLPHPSFPPNKSIPQPIYSIPHPITTSIPSSSGEIIHLSQHTHPSSQPQYYNQAYQAPLPYTSYIPTHTPYCVQSQACCSYIPTQPPQYSTYMPNPTTTTTLTIPSQQPTHHRERQNNSIESHSELHLRTPHLEFPLFSGENPRAWMLECDDVFNLVNISVDQRAKWGIAHIRGQAKTWLSSANLHLQSITWERLCEVLIDRFPDTAASDPMDMLQQLHQLTSVNSYIDSFENWMTAMKRGRNYLPQDFFVDRFISGLKETIKHNVLCQKPASLLSAYWYARQYEKSYLSSVKHNPAPATANRNPYPARQQGNRDNRPRPPDNRSREPRKCWYCPDNFIPGHRCPAMQRTLNAIQMQDHSDDEADDIHALLDPQEQPQQAEQVPVPIVASVFVPTAPVAQPVQEALCKYQQQPMQAYLVNLLSPYD